MARKSQSEKSLEQELRVELLNMTNICNCEVLDIIGAIRGACMVNYEKNLSDLGISKEQIKAIKASRSQRDLREKGKE